MSAFALAGAAVLLLAWLLAAAAGLAVRRWAALGAGAISAAGALVAAAYLLDGAPPATLALPIGLPGLPMTLALDGLSGFFLLLLMLLGAAAGAAALDERRPPATAPCLPVFLAAMALCLLAGERHQRRIAS